MASVRMPLAINDLMKTRQDDEWLRDIIKMGLRELAATHDLRPDMVMEFAKDIFDMVRKETGKFRQEAGERYPPSQHNTMFINIELPTKGKVANYEYGSKVVV